MAWLMLAQAIVAASGPVAIEGKEQAKSMTPQALADVLLEPGHPPVDSARVLEADYGAPPVSPDAAPRFEVEFATVPVPAPDEPAFCRRDVAKVVVTAPGPAATATLAWTTTRYRMETPCVGGSARYGGYKDAGTRRTMERLSIASKGRPAFPILYTDEIQPSPEFPRYASPAEALRAIPFEEVLNAHGASGWGRDTLERRFGARGEMIEFTVGGIWEGTVAHVGDRITHVILRRRHPPPF